MANNTYPITPLQQQAQFQLSPLSSSRLVPIQLPPLHYDRMAPSLSTPTKKLAISRLMSPPEHVLDSFGHAHAHAASQLQPLLPQTHHRQYAAPASVGHVSNQPMLMSPPISPYVHAANETILPAPSAGPVVDPILYPHTALYANTGFYPNTPVHPYSADSSHAQQAALFPSAPIRPAPMRMEPDYIYYKHIAEPPIRNEPDYIHHKRLAEPPIMNGQDYIKHIAAPAPVRNDLIIDEHRKVQDYIIDKHIAEAAPVRKEPDHIVNKHMEPAPVSKEDVINKHMEPAPVSKKDINKHIKPATSKEDVTNKHIKPTNKHIKPTSKEDIINNHIKPTSNIINNHIKPTSKEQDDIIDKHIAARSSARFGNAPPPTKEDYRAVLNFKVGLSEQLFNNPTFAREWLEREREWLRLDNRARGGGQFKSIVPKKAPVPKAKASRAAKPDRILKPSQAARASGSGPRPVRADASSASPPSRLLPSSRAGRSSASPPSRLLASSRAGRATPEPHRRTVAPNREDKNFAAIPDYCPPLDATPLRPHCMKIDWKGQPIDLSKDPNRHMLHPEERELAASLRLDCATYLTSKRRIFERRRECALTGKEFRKTDAQQACNIDVNKASKLWLAYEKVGWLDIRHVVQD